jgi:hypothetical protein
VPRSDAEARLGRLVAGGLLTDVDGSVAVAHALVRATAYAALLQRDLRRLHRRAADALGNATPGRRAWHRWHADQPSAAARLAGAGAEDARSRLSYQEAAALFDLGARAAERSGASPARCAQLRLDAGSCHLAAAALDDAMEAFAAACRE